MRKKAILVTTLGLALIGCAGANTAKAPTPATAPDPYRNAANVMVEFSGDLLTLEAAEKNLYIGTVIDKDTHRTINQAFKVLADTGPQIDALIAAGASSATIQAKIDAGLAQLNVITSATAALTPDTKQQITLAIQSVRIILLGVTAQLNPNAGGN